MYIFNLMVKCIFFYFIPVYLTGNVKQLFRFISDLRVVTVVGTVVVGVTTKTKYKNNHLS